MIELIIFEKDNILKNKIKNIIYKCFGPKEEFKILNYETTKKDNNQKIYILSSSNFKEIIDIAKAIRNSGDYSSIIIILSNINKERLNNNLLIFSYINYDKNIFINLDKTLNNAYSIFTKNNTFNFVYNRILYRIPLNDILYIEKEKNSNKCTIHTKNKTYEISSSIKQIEKDISYLNFMKVHRSCIVNLYNVTKYDSVKNIICFGNDINNLISREKRIILKETLLSLTKKD